MRHTHVCPAFIGVEVSETVSGFALTQTHITLVTINPAKSSLAMSAMVLSVFVLSPEMTAVQLDSLCR